MAVGFAVRQLAQTGLVANALRPIRYGPTAVPAFVTGWLTSELSPHLAAATAVDAAVHLVRSNGRDRSQRLGLAAAGLNLAGYSRLLAGGRRAAEEIENALVEALGPDYRTSIVRGPLPDDEHAALSALAMPFWMHHVDVVTKRRIAYAPGGRRYELNVYHRRDTPAGAPVLLQIHGGAWIIGTKDTQGIPLMLHMAARGWVCVAVNYPLSPRSRWPEHLIAVKRALQWIHEQGAGYGADPKFVAVTGGSAGGHLAAMVGLTAGDKSLQPGFEHVDTTVQACVPHYGVYDFTDESGARSTSYRLNSLLRPYVMPRDARYPDDYRAASPVHRITADAPPFLVIHGHHDSLVPAGEARAFVSRLRATSTQPVAYAEISGAQHAFDLFPSVRSAGVLRGVARFLEWTHDTRDTGAPSQNGASN